MKGAPSAALLSRGCALRGKWEVSELLRAYLRSTIGHFSPKDSQQTGTLTTKTIRPVAGCLGKKRGVKVSCPGVSKNLLQCSKKSSTKLQKQAPENSAGVFQTLARRPSRFSRHCEYISSWWVLPLLPELLDGFQMREVKEGRGQEEEEWRRRCKKQKKKECLAPRCWWCSTAAVMRAFYGVRDAVRQNKTWIPVCADIQQSKPRAS